MKVKEEPLDALSRSLWNVHKNGRVDVRYHAMNFTRGYYAAQAIFT